MSEPLSQESPQTKIVSRTYQDPGDYDYIASPATRTDLSKWLPLCATLVIGGLVIAFIVMAGAARQTQAKLTTQQSPGPVSSAAPVDNIRQVDDIKREGFDQCVAGDSEGCTYYMDKLRVEGRPNEAEYLKANLIVSHFTESDPDRMDQNLKLKKYGYLSDADLKLVGGSSTASGSADFMTVLNAVFLLKAIGKPSPKLLVDFDPMPAGGGSNGGTEGGGSGPADGVSNDGASSVNTAPDSAPPSQPGPGSITMKTKAGGGAKPTFDPRTGTLHQ